MAVKLPLVNYAGTTKELQSGDTVNSNGTITAAGTATLDFGVAPGGQVATVAVTGQSQLAVDSQIRLFISGDDSTTDHNTYEHGMAAMFVGLTAGTIVAGTGFTITAMSAYTLSGTFKVRWVYGWIDTGATGLADNYIINGNFDIWQRGTSAVTTNGAASADRWTHIAGGDTFSATLGAFASGDALYDPTSGNTAACNYLTVAVTSSAGAGNYAHIQQKIEDVRRLANKTVTISFWAKAASGAPTIGIECAQVFGTGGSPSSTVIVAAQSQALSTTWTKYTKTFAVPSINGKTIGTDANSSYTDFIFWLDAGSTYNVPSGTIGQSSKIVSIAQVKVEEGSVATQFVSRPPQQELALCQRYYFRDKALYAYYMFALCWTADTNTAYASRSFPVPMRAVPSLEQDGTASDYGIYTNSGYACSGAPAVNSASTANQGLMQLMFAGTLTANQTGFLRANNNTNAYIGWSAEL